MVNGHPFVKSASFHDRSLMGRTWKISTSTFCFCPLCFPPVRLENKHRKKKSDPQKEKNHHQTPRVDDEKRREVLVFTGGSPPSPSKGSPWYYLKHRTPPNHSSRHCTCITWPVMILGIFGAPLFKQKRDGKVWEKNNEKTSGIWLDVD